MCFQRESLEFFNFFSGGRGCGGYEGRKEVLLKYKIKGCCCFFFKLFRTVNIFDCLDIFFLYLIG